MIKNFLNSFDWRNASDTEKISKVMSLFKETPYDYEKKAVVESGLFHESATAYGCLVNKKAVCDGYSKAFEILTRLMGMKSSRIIQPDHAFNFVQINGEWYSFDGTRLESIENVMTLYKANFSIANNMMIFDNISNTDSIAINF